MNKETRKEKRGDRHRAKIAFVGAPSGSAAVTDWCNILNSYHVGTPYKGAYSGYNHTLVIAFTPNPDGTIQLLGVAVDGHDYTQKALDNGGKSIPVKYSKYANDCHKYDYYLGWELYGQFVDWFIALAGGHLSNLTLYSNYNDDGAKYFYFYAYGSWHWCNIFPPKVVLLHAPNAAGTEADRPTPAKAAPPSEPHGERHYLTGAA